MQQFLAETIESVMQSTYPNFEVILMDDGSKDSSFSIAKLYADNDKRIKLYSQKNQGASVARNEAIKKSKGVYILPVDADNLISPEYISKAANVLMANEQIKVVSCEAHFIGERKGVWRFPEFTTKLLARKNLIDNCAMYRKSDWEKCGGYCPEIMGREDWDFWIAMFKTGGEFCRLPLEGLYYRVRRNSKKVATRHLKRHLIGQLNSRHKAFFYKQLGGRIHFNRSWSILLNFIEHLLQKEKIVVSTRFKDFEDFVYYLPEETNSINADSNVNISITVNKMEVDVIKQTEFCPYGKSLGRKHFEKSNPSFRIGFYEKRFVTGRCVSYVSVLKSKESKPKASLIIAVYKNANFLKAVLDSLKLQTEQQFEIIIAEDGESTEMKDFLANYTFSNNWQHITQKDEGWRKNKCLNKAICATKSDWLIFIDGDCVLHPRFVEMHIQQADEKSILAGKRVKLDEKASTLLLAGKFKSSDMQNYLLPKLFVGKGKIKFLEDGIFISPNGLFGFITILRKANKLKGCNMSFSKKAIYAINGFDEDYQLPAIGEDIDLTWRFDAAGFKHVSVRNLAVQYHLHHKESWVDQSENSQMCKNKQIGSSFYCENGITKI